MPKKKLRKDIKNDKEKKLFNNLLKATHQFMQGRSFVPLTETELMERLHLHEFHRPVLQKVLKDLVKQGTAEVTRGRYSWKKASNDIVKGVLNVHPRGFGFLKPDDSSLYPQDIFIPKHLTQNAVDGDTVEVLINNESISEKGPEGKVIAILSRGRTHLAGIIREVDKQGNLSAYVPMLGMAQRVILETQADLPLRVGDRIVMEVIEWGTKETTTYCKVSHHLGHISDPSCDTRAAIEEYELRGDFPNRAIEEAQNFGKQVSRKDIEGREDLRSIECFTIDPDTAKDFDDAVSLAKDHKGHYHLGVHIADVSHYVQIGTALDEEAQIRCNSTYFPGYCLPMLPKELSDNLCSLKPKVNRLTVSVLMQFDAEGNLLDYRIIRSVIKSAKRFTYREAKEVLDHKKTSPHAKTLALMVELCGLLKRKRYERGSIEFGIPELVIIVDEKGMPQKTDYVVYDITHQLVEEFMLKANEIVATHLSEQGKNLTYRVHDEPTEENLKDFALLASAFGFRLSEKPTPKEIQKLFDEAMSTPYGQYLATSYIRRMRLAMYSPENIGHYGLSLSYYCHFTSPIRRYIDLVIHRILFNEGDDLETLEMIAAHCSEQERISAKAENSVLLLKKLRLLQELRTKDPYRDYEAVVTRVKNFGVFFEVPQFMLESYLHVSELEDDYYVYEEPAIQLRGVRHGRVYHAGDKINVILKEVDFITLESKWYLADQKFEVPSKKKKKRTERKARKKSSARKNQKMKLPRDYYRHVDVLFLSQDLLGKYLFTHFNGELTGGMIVETEAYRAPEDRASHAFGHRRTQRNEVMYAHGGLCYVYLCYGIHSLFNVVTNEENVPHAILIRAIEPTEGIEIMLKRRGKQKLERSLTAGPGALAKALGIDTRHNGEDLTSHSIWIEDRGIVISEDQIIASPRVGVDYAGEDAALPWRFRLKGSPWTSKP